MWMQLECVVQPNTTTLAVAIQLSSPYCSGQLNPPFIYNSSLCQDFIQYTGVPFSNAYCSMSTCVFSLL
jgi:hypothetical protein